MKSKLTNLLLSLSILIIIFGVGFKIGEYKSKILPINSVLTNESISSKVDLSLFWTTWNKIETKFIDKKKIDYQKMVYGAIKGMVASLEDPYTVFLTPEENNQSKNDLQGKLEGIGAQLGLKDNRIIVIAPLKKSPAEKAGIKAGDFITKVDGASTKDLSLPQAVLKIRGPKGSHVKITIERDNKEMVIDIVRDQIIVKSVEMTTKNNLAIVTINQFGENTNNEWDSVVSQIVDMWKNKSINGLILDLRDNPGGYLESSVYLASEFLSKNMLIVKQESTTYENRDYYSEKDGKLRGIPLAILINKGSASASEIMAGALRDHNKAILIGEKSFGKGSVQEALDLDKGAGLHVTIAKWILPNGDWINSKGITPNIKVDLVIKEGNTVTDETDAQLQRAILELTK